MDPLEIRSDESLSGSRTLFLKGPVTLGNIFEFQDLVRQVQAKSLIIVLDEVSYMDSAGLGAILGAYASCQRHGRQFGLANVSPRVRTVLQVAEVDTLIPWYDTFEAARLHLASQAESA
ncbi:MAG: STAS domain-containing protein [Acidobacteriia bacterium]|nr:STAS domain-containing protein [Terriglobia bacterium]